MQLVFAVIVHISELRGKWVRLHLEQCIRIAALLLSRISQA